MVVLLVEVAMALLPIVSNYQSNLNYCYVV